MAPVDLLADLEARGLVHDSTDRAALATRLAEGPITLYCGFDPTAESLGWWNLMNLVTLRRFQEAGHRPIALAGGATGMIGDPSGRSEERVLLDDVTLARNLEGITEDLRRVLSFDGPAAARVVDNAAWTRPVTLLEFLRDVGKHVTVNQMVAKESVRARMEGDTGISFTEFSYMLLQAQDFMWLAEHEGCELQIGGSDQWGNITVGIDLIRKKLGQEAYGLTSPLLTDAHGRKMGKSTGGDVFMSPTRTSPYRFFQLWMQVDDALVGDRLRKFTFLAMEEIEAIVAGHERDPGGHEAQRALAREVTMLVHGPEATDAAEAASKILFGSPLDGITPGALGAVAAEVPGTDVGRERITSGADLVELLVECGLAASKGDARRSLAQGAVYVNNERANVEVPFVGDDALLFGRYVLLRHGKRTYHLLRVH